jgi:intron-binding protein aquarius
LEFRKKYGPQVSIFFFISPLRSGIKYVRAGEIVEIRDEDDAILNDLSRPDERAMGRIGTKRKFKLKLDPAQYYEDMKVMLPRSHPLLPNDLQGGVECYESLNLLVRRQSKENNFKSVLKTVSDLQKSTNLEQ